MSRLFRGIDGQGDWLFGAGKQSYLAGQDAVVADIGTSLWMFLNDCFFAMDVGIDWWNLLGAKSPNAEQAIIAQCRAAIVQIEEVVRIVSVTTNIDRRSRSLVITYVVDTAYKANVIGQVFVNPNVIIPEPPVARGWSALTSPWSTYTDPWSAYT